jgi:hypothetical protein
MKPQTLKFQSEIIASVNDESLENLRELAPENNNNKPNDPNTPNNPKALGPGKTRV